MASLFVAILLGKGICYCKRDAKISGKLFAEFLENNVLDIFKSRCNPTGNVFIIDGDPSHKLQS